MVACVSTVTEKPNSPEVFLQLEYTWYLWKQQNNLRPLGGPPQRSFVSVVKELTDPRVSLVLRKSKQGSCMSI